MRLDDYETIPITWVRYNVLFKGRNKVWFAICGESKRICKFTSDRDVMTLIVVRDLLLHRKKGECEEARRCVDVDCPFNRATPATLARELGMKRIPKFWQDGIKTMNHNKNPDGSLADFSEYVGKYPGSLVSLRGTP